MYPVLLLWQVQQTNCLVKEQILGEAVLMGVEDQAEQFSAVSGDCGRVDTRFIFVVAGPDQGHAPLQTDRNPTAIFDACIEVSPFERALCIADWGLKFLDVGCILIGVVLHFDHSLCHLRYACHSSRMC